jgi:hypothetical protein
VPIARTVGSKRLPHLRAAYGTARSVSTPPHRATLPVLASAVALALVLGGCGGGSKVSDVTPRSTPEITPPEGHSAENAGAKKTQVTTLSSSTSATEASGQKESGAAPPSAEGSGSSNAATGEPAAGGQAGNTSGAAAPAAGGEASSPNAGSAYAGGANSGAANSGGANAGGVNGGSGSASGGARAP